MIAVDAPITPCPGCSLSSSENYLRRRLCWECYTALEEHVERECSSDRAIRDRFNGMRGHE